MNSRTLRLVAGFGGLLATAGFGFGIVQAALAQQGQPTPQAGGDAGQAAQAMPMEEVLARLKAEGYEIERDKGRYEVEAKNRDGRTVELHLDAVTGKILEAEQEDDD